MLFRVGQIVKSVYSGADAKVLEVIPNGPMPQDTLYRVEWQSDGKRELVAGRYLR